MFDYAESIPLLCALHYSGRGPDHLKQARLDSSLLVAENNFESNRSVVDEMYTDMTLGSR
jgi:hypothetical protein